MEFFWLKDQYGFKIFRKNWLKITKPKNHSQKRKPDHNQSHCISTGSCEYCLSIRPSDRLQFLPQIFVSVSGVRRKGFANISPKLERTPPEYEARRSESEKKGTRLNVLLCVEQTGECEWREFCRLRSELRLYCFDIESVAVIVVVNCRASDDDESM
jgi:hypothetical protein